MVGVVLLVVKAWGDKGEGGCGLGGGEEAVLVGSVAAALEEQILAVARASHAHVEAFVRLLENKRVVTRE